jgi:hypothetical protein
MRTSSRLALTLLERVPGYKAIAVAVLAGLLTVPATASGAAAVDTVVVDVPVEEIFLSPCTGEEILLTGDIHFVVHSVIDANGGFHLSGTAASHLAGVGLTTGQRYRVNAANPMHTMEVGATTDTLVSHFSIVAPGPDNNLLGHATNHFTRNANGEITGVTVVNFFATCDGG